MRMRIRRLLPMIAATVSALLLASCAVVVTGHPSLADAPNAKLPVIGGSTDTFDTTAKNALSDIEAFWRREYPKVSGGAPLTPLQGGLYSVDGARVASTGTAYAPIDHEACIARDAEFIIDNAAYCLADDSITWDRSPTHLFGRLAQHYGRLVVALVFAHEFGHAISARLGVFRPGNRPPTIDTESQADCAAGAWAASALKGQEPHFRNVTAADIDDALEGFLDGRDKTPGTIAEISHGNGFDRLSALADGMDHGVTYCYSSHYFDRTFTERPYSSPQDYASGGNEPLSKATAKNSFLMRDLNRYFGAAAKAAGKTFHPVTIDQTTSPSCPGFPTTQFLYCPSDNTVAFTPGFAKRAYYSLPDITLTANGSVVLLFGQPADFGLGEMLAMAWGFAVQHQLDGRNLDDRAAVTAAVCYTGAYAKNVNVATATNHQLLTLSPSDLDEAVSVLLNRSLQEQSFGERGSTGLDRVQAFVHGYANGFGSC